ncbi:MAG: MOSC domain-containing protein [Dehalococcoidia bacterium]|nr:MOSC domain-containing protein [Dehalococcoidia bacterium]
MSNGAQGTIVSIYLCTGHRDPMKSVESADMTAGFGIEGDRHAVSEGVRTARQVLIMDEETLGKFSLSSGEVRENITTSGIDMHSIEAGQRVSLGDSAVVEITGFCTPCARMDEIRDGLRVELEEQRGMLATVIQSGSISVGDAVKAKEAAAV